MSAIAVRRKHVLSVARALADITSTDPVLIRSSVLKAVVEAAGSDACVFYSFVDVGGVASVEGLTAEGPKRSVAVRPFLETEAPHWYDVSRPPEPALTGFWSPMLAVPRAQFEASPMFEQVCKPYGIHETAGLFFYHGEKYLGTLSALWMRPKDFTLEERALLMPLVAPVRAGIVAADCLSRRGLASNGRSRAECARWTGARSRHSPRRSKLPRHRLFDFAPRRGFGTWCASSLRSKSVAMQTRS
jgi:hypothetical protein